MASELRAFEPLSRGGADARLSEAHHRIANNLALVAGFVRLQSSALTRSGARVEAAHVALALEETSARIETIGRLHRLLSSDPGQQSVDIGAYLRETCRALDDSMAFAGDMEIRFHCDSVCHGAPDQAGPIALIVTELATNALKYAHPAGLPGHVEIRCNSRPDGSILLTVEDDGVGLPEDFDPETDGGLGMRVVRSLAAQLRGVLTFESTGLGLRVGLFIPASLEATGK